MSLDPFTRLLHAASSRDDGAPSSPPIDLSTVHVSAGAGDASPYAYGRISCPTWEALEATIAALEEAPALAFASGQAASCALMIALAAERKRLLLPNDGYYGTRKLAAQLEPFGLRTDVLDMTDLPAVERALRGAAWVLWAESPTNPFLSVLDLAALGRLAQAAGAPMVVDNTTATAALQRPLELGASATVTSLTKSSSGHSDVILGCVATRDEDLLERLRAWRTAGGGIPGPFEAWLARRGLLTLPLRVERQSASALALAEHLAAHRRVRRAHYPGLATASAALACRQMPRGRGPLLSFELDGDAREAERVVRAARLLRPATSFGGIESSWERRARWPSESAPESLIRVSVGLEPVADLIADVDQALG